MIICDINPSPRASYYDLNNEDPSQTLFQMVKPEHHPHVALELTEVSDPVKRCFSSPVSQSAAHVNVGYYSKFMKHHEITVVVNWHYMNKI